MRPKDSRILAEQQPKEKDLHTRRVQSPPCESAAGLANALLCACGSAISPAICYADAGLPVVRFSTNRGSLIPRSAVAAGSDATQSASKMGCNVQSDHLERVANVWQNLLLVLSFDNAPR